MDSGAYIRRRVRTAGVQATLADVEMHDIW